MPGFNINYLVEHSGEAALDFSTGTEDLIFRPVVPCEIWRWGVILTVAITSADLVMTGNHREAGGAALTPSGAGDVGTVTVDQSDSDVNFIGAVIYTETVNPNATFGLAGGDRSAAGTETAITTKPFLVLPGEEVQFVSDNGPAAGDGVIFVHYAPLGWQDQPTRRQRAAVTAPVADDGWLYRTTVVTS